MVSHSLYVDDVQVCFSSCNLAICERQVQLTANRMSRWADQNGFKFSAEKTVAVCFSRKRGMFPEPSLSIKGTPIPVKSEHKFLGIVFNSKLTFGPHIKALRLKCQRKSNLLKVLAHRSWGSDRVCLLRIYRACVRSVLDYGSIVYGSAKPSTLKMLDPVHHQGIRLATGAFRTSPVPSLYAESNEWSLDKRRFYLSTQYYLRLRTLPQHPNFSLINDIKYERSFQNKPSVTRPFVLRVKDAVQKYSFDISSPVMETPHRLAPWDDIAIACNLALTKYNKRIVDTSVIKQEFSR